MQGQRAVSRASEKLMASVTTPPPAGGSLAAGVRDALPLAASAPAIVRIVPPHGLFELRLRELWEYRELLYFFVWRDVKVRYKQTVIGVAWVILQPLMTMGVFTIFWQIISFRNGCKIVCSKSTNFRSESLNLSPGTP